VGLDTGFRRHDGDVAASVRPARRGFTLVELMVVLVIIGLTSVVVMLAMPDPRGELRHDAERFAARIHAAQDKAIVDARDMALVVDPAGYAFEQRARGGWVPVDDRAFARLAWSEGTQALVGRAGQGRAVFDVTGLSEPIDVTLLRDGRRVAVSVGADGAVHVSQ
jgi:general secretion pathway protein H